MKKNPNSMGKNPRLNRKFFDISLKETSKLSYISGILVFFTLNIWRVLILSWEQFRIFWDFELKKPLLYNDRIFKIESFYACQRLITHIFRSTTTSLTLSSSSCDCWAPRPLKNLRTTALILWAGSTRRRAATTARCSSWATTTLSWVTLAKGSKLL